MDWKICGQIRMTHRKYAHTRAFHVNLQKQHLVWLLTLANSKFNGLKFKSAIHGICVLCDVYAHVHAMQISYAIVCTQT